MKTSQEIVDFLCMRIGHIYFRPLMYCTLESLEVELHNYHEILAEIFDQQEVLTTVHRNRLSQEKCGTLGFARRYREKHSSASEQEIATYVIEQWRAISKKLGFPVPYATLREIFRDKEQLRNLFLDEE